MESCIVPPVVDDFDSGWIALPSGKWPDQAGNRLDAFPCPSNLPARDVSIADSICCGVALIDKSSRG